MSQWIERAYSALRDAATPFALTVDDLTGTSQAEHVQAARRRAIKALLNNGVAVKEITRILPVSKQTVYNTMEPRCEHGCKVQLNEEDRFYYCKTHGKTNVSPPLPTQQEGKSA